MLAAGCSATSTTPSSRQGIAEGNFNILGTYSGPELGWSNSCVHLVALLSLIATILFIAEDGWMDARLLYVDRRDA